MSTMDDPAMEDPMFQVGHNDGGTPDQRALAEGMSPAELAATRGEHERLAEGALVRADELVAGYLPGVNILNGCDFYLQDGELVGIIGPNGAGKSTLLKTLFGLIPVRSGAVTLRGEDITSAPAHRLVSLGVGYVPAEQQRVPLAVHRGEHADGRVPAAEGLPTALRLRGRAVPHARGAPQDQGRVAVGR
jgi:branched-chain amino acid transport system ATP-binding protein